MPATTPNNALPYPLGADPIDVAGDIQGLAERLDALLGLSVEDASHGDYSDVNNRLDNMSTHYREAISGLDWKDRLLVQGVSEGFSTDASSNCRITFPIPFSFKPVMTITSADGMINAFIYIIGITTTYADVKIARGDGSGHPSNWVALSYTAVGIQPYI